MNNPLLDKEFLKELNGRHLKELYAEIIALNADDEVLETIEGHVIKGTINVDGTSAVRRTCNLTIAADELNIHEYYWGLHTKFKLSVGMTNDFNDKYPEVIWFPQGIFVISSFSTSQALSGHTINIQGRDKMVMLNGELGGTIHSLTHNFGEYDYINEHGYKSTSKTLLKDIIIDAVHEFGNEPLYNIIVNDLDDLGLELLEYRGKEPLYLLIDNETQEPSNITLDGTLEYNTEIGKVTLNSIPVYNPLFELEQSGVVIKPTVIYDEISSYTVAKLKYGMTAGYRQTELIFAGDLIMKVGESVTKMLDKIIKMLGEYEYYYDVDGRFIFQRKRTYLNTTWNSIINNTEELYADNRAYTSDISYSFEDDSLIISYSNNPNINNIRNDFSVWGTRTSVSGKQLPVHMRFAIDTKPFLYVSIDKVYYTTLSEEKLKEYIDNWYLDKSEFYDKPQINNLKSNLDWRELIYQMAIDYRKHNREEDFYLNIIKNNLDLYKNGKTGYEQYYMDMEGFWRQLYNPEYSGSYEPIYLTENGYKEKAEEYFYATPLYIQCNNSTPYHSNMTYYSYQDDYIKQAKTLQPVISLSREEYESNPENYYYIDSENPTEIVSTIIIEPYKDLINGQNCYYNSVGNLISKVDYNTYIHSPESYYFKDKITYQPCGIVTPYKNYKSYYTKNEEVVEVLTEKDYYKQPGLYYFKEFVYKNCKNEPYNSTAAYYQKQKDRTTDEEIYVKVILSETRYNNNPEKYYIREKTANFADKYELISCVRSELEYKPEYEYYKISYQDKEEIYIPVKISNLNEYNNLISYGNLYIKNFILTCCKHPIDYQANINFYKGITDEFYKDNYWSRDVYENPEGLNFWFDFLEENSELQKYGCHAIGDRPKAINDTNVKAIYYRETPTVIFVNSDDWNNIPQSKLGYTYIQLPASVENLFSISSQGKSAKTVIDQYLYQHVYDTSTINFSTLPIYNLQPNTRIFVYNENSGINGEYILIKYSIAIAATGTMTINAAKAVDRLY